MNEQLENLMKLQDLDTMIRELKDQKMSKQMKKLGFPLNSGDQLVKTRNELAKKIKPEYLTHYEKLMKNYGRAVVPLKEGTCFGCFIIQPTLRATRLEEELKVCERCQRFMYPL